MIDRQGHVVELQSIRGIAAMVVLVGHSLTYAEVLPGWLAALAVVTNGHAAVVLFFVLSGYVLTRSLHNRVGGTDDLLRFYMKRLFRIYPALWVATLVGGLYLATMHFSMPADGTSQAIEQFVNMDRLHLPWLFLAPFGMPYVLPQVWSIFVELVGSALLPVLAWALFTRRWLFGVMAMVLFALSLAVPQSPCMVAVYLVDFAIGAALAAPPRWLLRQFARLSARGSALLFAASAVALIGMRGVWVPGYHDALPQLAEAAAASLMILLLIHSRLDLPVLRSRVMTRLGDLSYSVYLFHFTIMMVIGHLLATVLSPARQAGWFEVVLIATTLPATWVVAAFTYRFVELPGIALGARVVGRWAPRIMPTAVPATD